MFKLVQYAYITLSLFFSVSYANETHNELSYDSQVESKSRFKCLYGYFASKTGDHVTAIEIFEDCIERWQDVYSMIWLAHLYENGAGVEKDLKQAFELIKRGANTDDSAGYSSLAKYHYGVALFEGRGTIKNIPAAFTILREASSEGVATACEFLKKQGQEC